MKATWYKSATGCAVGGPTGGRGIIRVPRFHNAAAVCRGAAQGGVDYRVSAANTGPDAQRPCRAILLAGPAFDAGITKSNCDLTVAAGENRAGANIETHPAPDAFRRVQSQSDYVLEIEKLTHRLASNSAEQYPEPNNKPESRRANLERQSPAYFLFYTRERRIC